MSVDKLHRTESKFGVYDRARRIRKMVNDFLDRDFGIKVCKRDIRNAAVGKYRRLEKTGRKAQPDRRLLYFHAREWEHKRKRGTHGQGSPGMETGKIPG